MLLDYLMSGLVAGANLRSTVMTLDQVADRIGDLDGSHGTPHKIATTRTGESGAVLVGPLTIVVAPTFRLLRHLDLRGDVDVGEVDRAPQLKLVVTLSLVITNLLSFLRGVIGSEVDPLLMREASRIVDLVLNNEALTDHGADDLLVHDCLPYRVFLGDDSRLT